MDLTLEQVNEAIDKKVADTLAPIKTQLGELTTKVGSIDGFGEQLKTINESIAALEIGSKPGEKPAEKKGEAATTTGAGLTTEQATELFNKMLSERDTAAATTAQQQAAHDAWIKKHAPKLAGTATAKRIFGGASSDEARKAALDEYIADLKATGVQPPDLGATAAGEGGQASSADSKATQEAAALEAAGKVKATVL